MVRSLEIGCVYRKGSRHYLAVDEAEVIGWASRSNRLVRLYVGDDQYIKVKAISLDELCDKMHCTLEQLDAFVRPFFAPRLVGRKSLRPRSTPRERKHEIEEWREIRTARIRRTA